MRRKVACTAELFLSLVIASPAALSAAPCTTSPTALCLNGSRFEAHVSWRDSHGRTGVGSAVSLTADTGYFWFFGASNVELIVKVLDARTLNGKFWVFFGALSSVQYDLTVTDTSNGASKAYHNPLGQFASVGDTSAFAADVGAPAVSESVTIAGTPAPEDSVGALQRWIDRKVASAEAEFTPCASVGSTLLLNNCRFALDVEWTDSQGRTGRGTPVQLTNDTGYFWFFGAANVELMVKILDARPLNGSFWVFYGALSNVGYRMTVTDSLTGALRTYTNDRGTFASVGDTAAFHPGRAVAPSPDAGRAVVADVDAAGGSLSATAADGTHFVLQIPMDALPTQTSIRMTPLGGVGGLPLSRGLIGGVQLEPEGLRLLEPATLTIHPPTAPRPGTVAFTYRGSGEDLAFDFSDVENGDIRQQILHFSGYGAGTAAPGDVGNQSTYFPMDPVNAIRQQVLQIIDRAQSHTDQNGNEIPPEISLEERYVLLVQLFEDAFYQLIIPRLQAVLPDCNRQAIREATDLAFGTIRMIQFFTDLDQDPGLKLQVDAATSVIIDILQQCLEKAHRDCVAYKDPLQAWDMVFIQKLLEKFGAAITTVLEPGGPIEKCLRFQLEFNSAVNFEGGTSTEKRKIHASVPLRIDPAHSTQDVSWAGTATTVFADEFIDIPPCTTTNIQTVNGSITVGDPIPALLFPLALTSSFDPTQFDVRFGYDPGSPMDTYSLRCAGQNVPGPSLGSYWREDFLIMHTDEYLPGQGLFVRGWTMLIQGGVFARKKYQRGLSSAFLTEDTVLEIQHTPDKEP